MGVEVLIAPLKQLEGVLERALGKSWNVQLFVNLARKQGLLKHAEVVLTFLLRRGVELQP